MYDIRTIYWVVYVLDTPVKPYRKIATILRFLLNQFKPISLFFRFYKYRNNYLSYLMKRSRNFFVL